jgi:hypothetical protein
MTRMGGGTAIYSEDTIPKITCRALTRGTLYSPPKSRFICTDKRWGSFTGWWQVKFWHT